MSFDDINKQMEKQRELARHRMEIQQEWNFQKEIHSQTLEFQKEQTDRFIQEYKETNLRLTEINQSLQKQIDEQKTDIITAKNESKRTKRRGWIQFGISSLIGVAGVIVALLAFLIGN